MNVELLKKIVGYTLLFAFAAVLITGIICSADRAADGMWPWETHPEVDQ